MFSDEKEELQFQHWCADHDIPFSEVTHRHHFFMIEERRLALAFMQGELTAEEVEHGRKYLLARLIKHYQPNG
ncbi:hypothetical protein [Alkalicoccus chagannorensis]|uniref:hypothetical protein n=1 Tax=Alkalicoccus chagannorensis TaxID=427072 RepID=UPI0004282070|nr:hypothetical protein [Alkalicoccus chagannorensis]